MIRHDQSDVTVVTTCTDCPWWSALSFSLAEAEQSEANHKVKVHGMSPSMAGEAARMRRVRAARRAV